MKVNIKKLSEWAKLPRYAHEGDAGADVCVPGNFMRPLLLTPGEYKLIPLGFALAVPPGFEAQMRPRSGLAMNQGITVLNSPGTIDSSYRGGVGVILINHSQENFEILPGMKIAQLVIAPVMRGEFIECEDLDETTRGAGGFGSTSNR